MDIASALRTEITRLARKAVRTEIEPLRASIAAQRKQIAALKVELSTMKRDSNRLHKLTKNVVSEKRAASGDGSHARYSSKSLKSQRARLGLSAEQFGKLLGVSAQTIYNLESNPDQRPRQAAIDGLAIARKMGRREAAEKLAALGVVLQKRRAAAAE